MAETEQATLGQGDEDGVKADGINDELAAAAAAADAEDDKDADGGGQAAGDEDEDEKAKRLTDYMVLSGKTEKGPWDEVGVFAGPGQIAVKKDAIAQIGEKAQEKYFLAIPMSSYMPQKPKVKITTLITF